MTPFPENEILTINRLKVALRKSDFRSLKEGAYKLHEKYHSGHQFENIADLKEILMTIEGNRTIPDDISGILVPTIKDILATQEKFNNVDMPVETQISSLTSLSYSVGGKQTSYGENKDVQGDSSGFALRMTENEPLNTTTENEPLSATTQIEPLNTITQRESLNATTKDKTDEMFYKENTTSQEPKLSAFDVFSAPRIQPQPAISEPLQQNIPLEPYKEPYKESYSEPFKEQYSEPFQEFKEPKIEPQLQPQLQPQIEPQLQVQTQSQLQPQIEQQAQSQIQPYFQPIQQIEQNSTPIQPLSFNAQTTAKEEKEDNSITIFFSQPSTPEKISNINKLNQIISNSNETTVSLGELAKLINEIKTQANVNMAEILPILERLNSTNNVVNLITNSQSSNLIELLIDYKISYSIFDPQEDKRINILPILGLTNLHKCCQCQNEFLDTNEEISPYLLQCPKCRGVMYPNLYEPQGRIDLDYYNSSLLALANSNTWVLIHPTINEKLTFNMIRTALKVSAHVKKIYILDKDINIRESYKKLLLAINPDVEININTSALEEFLKALR